MQLKYRYRTPKESARESERPSGKTPGKRLRYFEYHYILFVETSHFKRNMRVKSANYEEEKFTRPSYTRYIISKSKLKT